MIDIHCHILPGIDDGAATYTESLAMARTAVNEGIDTIIATPHHQNGSYENKKLEIITYVDELNAQLKQEGIGLKILPGQENRIYGEIIQDYNQNEIITLGGNSSYLLIEFPSGFIPQYAEQLLFDLQMKGLFPIIVHPERNKEFMEHPDRLYKFVKNGVATQITASSYTGHFGKRVRKFTYQLIEANLTHFIASDAHNTKNRTFNMAQSMDLLEKEFGLDMVYYFTENAELVIDEKHIFKERPQRIKRRKFLGLF
ncbi:protein-tyrosine phosphatase [Oikeobacillus pervagus]|uniref:Tyrosine-protein phosphatase n=1 Tax=Oikeobacillus pervagus TaxID=1325931 RepID=A0AAJ1T6X9_9BACI|nr:CpsB/CapC family capsule biosynthesis tyrosine phosphatase [Oikeobacillus pervagus]MDQ0216276.1 protein-tyrosine phosphatase [Oikeobacillus pervagus]